MDDVQKRIEQLKNELAKLEAIAEHKNDDPLWNDPQVCYDHAEHLYIMCDGGNYSEVEKYFLRSAELGVVEAYRRIGDIYRLNYDKSDDAIVWYWKAIAAGDFRAYLYLGTTCLSLDKCDIGGCIDAWDNFTNEVISLIRKEGYSVVKNSDIARLYYHMVMQAVGQTFFYKERSVEIITHNHNHKILIGMCSEQLVSITLSSFQIKDASDIDALMAMSERQRNELLTYFRIFKECTEYFLLPQNQAIASTWYNE